MCLLIQQFKDTDFTDDQLHDFYSRNRDGIGVMWAEDGALKYSKLLPRTSQDSVDFYNRTARGKDCCVHYRMRTHGDIDHENCHPYSVFGFEGDPEGLPMLLMHNGILHTGNSRDTTKSDTWHYIRDFLQKMLAKDPDLAFSPEFAEVIGKHIGPNKFAITAADGRTAIINRHQGVTWKGAWLSNTYAWDAARYISPPKSTYYTPSMSGGWNASPPKLAAPAAKVSKVKLTKTGGKKIGPAQTKQPSHKGLFDWEEFSPQASKMFNKAYRDDVVEIRGTLNTVYFNNVTAERQIYTMIEEMGVVAAYRAVELLAEGHITESDWDKLSTNRAEMRVFANTPVTEWYSQ